MKYIVNSSEMKSCDKGTIEYYGVPSLVLMERAAMSVAEEIKDRCLKKASVLIVCGSGNNGGDGMAIGRLLHLDGYDVQVVFAGKDSSASEETRKQLAILEKYQIPLTTSIPNKKYDVIVDSLFGIGLCRGIEGNYYELIEHMNGMSGLKVAVDIASGINGDNGQIMGIAFKADITVTFAFRKVGHLLYPGAEYTGELVVKEIGIDNHGFLGKFPMIYSLDSEDVTTLPERPANANKGTFGKVLVIAGAVNMAGAACFSAKAAYRTGAGLVRVLTHQSNRVIVQSLVPEAVLTTYEESTETEQKKILECIDWASVIVLGPGLGQNHFSLLLVETVLKNAKVPCIVDADALNLIAKFHLSYESHKAPIIITPHVGEMSRLCRQSIDNIKKDPMHFARIYAAEHQVITVLKDARTITAIPDGRLYINRSGNCGMSTGGSGDVLTGIIAGLLCQGCSADKAASLGVYLHGLAGDAVAARLGQHSLMASDLIEGITLILKGI